MQVPNPQYKFYKMLAGTWTNSDSSCTVIPNEFANLKISYGNAKLESSYSVLETGPLSTTATNSMGLFGVLYERHNGEELNIQMNNRALSDGTQNLYNVKCLWYGEEKLNLELLDIFNGQIKTLILTREAADTAPASGYVCECGYTGPFGRFCPNCGKAVEEVYTCLCGYRSKGVKFCPNCGQPTGLPAAPVSVPAAADAPAVPEVKEEKLGWKCPQCGAENQDGKCSVCGAEIDPVLLFSITSFMATNPPVRTFTYVYEYSNAELLLDINGKRRLIPAEVKEQAMEIIRKYGLDDPDFTDASAMGIMGGSVNISFKDGDKYVHTSMNKQGFAVNSAQSELSGLFNKA